MEIWKTSLFVVIICILLGSFYKVMVQDAVEEKKKEEKLEFSGTVLEKEIRIILIGKTGAGKSTTGNSILGELAFKAGNSLFSITRKASYNTTWRFGRKLVVVDTPGLEDTKLNEKEVITEITKSYTMVSPGPHAIVMLMHHGRFTNEDRRILDTYKDAFGENFEKYLVLIFNGKEKLEKQYGSVKGFLNNIPEDHTLKQLVDAIHYRVFTLDDSDNPKNQREDIFQILYLIETMKLENNPSYFETKLSWYTEQLYYHLGLDSEIMKAYNDEEKKDILRKKIFDMFIKYSSAIATGIAFTYASGYGISAAISILTILIDYARM